MANDRRKSKGRSRYFFERDVSSSAEDLKDLWNKSLDQQAGINKYRGIGRGVGALGGILLAGSGAGIPLLALAGGLGSYTGSQIGKHLGESRYGSPAKADIDPMWHRDIAEEQRESVGDYWKGMKEQIAVNTLQDAITAGMYGTKVLDIAGKFKDIPSNLASKAADLGFDKTALRLGGQPAGMAMPPSVEASRATLQQPNVSGVFPDIPTRLKLPEVIHDPSAYPTASTAATSGYSTTAPSQRYKNIIGYPDVTGAEMLDDFPLDELNIDALESSFKQRKEGAGFLDRDPKELGVQFGPEYTTAGPSSTGVNISTDMYEPYEDWLNLASQNTQGQITPSLTGNMQQQISQQMSPPSQYDFWTTLPAGRGPTEVQQTYNPRLQQQLLQKSKYFRR